MIHQYRIDNVQFEAYGRMIVAWTKAPATAPKTLSEFTTAIGKIGGTVDPSCTKFRLIVATADEIILRLPPATLVTAMETQLKDSKQPYTLPSFYSTHAFDNVTPKVQPNDIAAKEALYFCRVADYSLGQCG